MWACSSGAATPVQQVSFKTEERWQRQRQSPNPQVYFTSAITGMQAHTLWLDGWDTCRLWLAVLFLELKKKSHSTNKTKQEWQKEMGKIFWQLLFFICFITYTKIFSYREETFKKIINLIYIAHTHALFRTTKHHIHRVFLTQQQSSFIICHIQYHTEYDMQWDVLVSVLWTGCRRSRAIPGPFGL